MKRSLLVASVATTFTTCVFSLLNIIPALSSPTVGKKAMVVTDQGLASQVGLQILQAGGNAVDAAVAVGYALAVVDPCCGNLGGGGFMTIHFANGKNTFINFREKASEAATQNLFLDLPGWSTQSYLASGVPGTVLGLDRALQEYGTLPRWRVIAPALQLAQRGFVLKVMKNGCFLTEILEFRIHSLIIYKH